jgi:hypothetical protein
MIGLVESLLVSHHSDEEKKTLNWSRLPGVRLSNLVNDILDFSRLQNLIFNST